MYMVFIYLANRDLNFRNAGFYYVQFIDTKLALLNS